MARYGGTYRINGKMFRLDPELYQLLKTYGVTANEIQKEYWNMKQITPGLRIVNHNHAAYSAFLKKSRKKEGGFL